MATRNMAQVGRETLVMSVDEAIAVAHLDPRRVERLEAEADALFARLNTQAAQYESFMGSPKRRTPQEASAEAMRTHFVYCAALGALNEANVDATAYLGQSCQEIAETVAAKAAARRRGRGARTVANKYGAQAAYNITGHHIRG